MLKGGVSNVALVQVFIAAGLQTREGVPVSDLSSSGTISMPNSGALRFFLQARTIGYAASIQAMVRLKISLEDTRSLNRDEINNQG